ncbi:hypothetical protein [Paenibacillus thermotolerans]|uniref:hypothetical protein n=1 Tax=Paenibacillus thermotolerans TaxID=3027807 RepID=UPI0023674E6C|nr:MULTISPECIES: hypothetical protein [unclassified Paenibacillus]
MVQSTTTNENENIDLKEIIIEYRNGNNAILEELFWKNQETKKILQINKKAKGRNRIDEFRYNIPQFNSKITQLYKIYYDYYSREEIKSIFNELLLDFMSNKDGKYPLDSKGRVHNHRNLVNWILTVTDNEFKDRVEVLSDEKKILRPDFQEKEKSATDEGDIKSSYNLASYKRWKEDYNSETFQQFIERINFKEHFTELQQKVYDDLLEYYSKKYNTKRSDRVTYESIGSKYKVSAQRVKEIEEEIGTTIKRLYESWFDKQSKFVPVSQRIEHFLRFNEMVKEDRNDNMIVYKFKFLVSWLKLNYQLGEQVVRDFNKKDFTTSIFDVLTDGGTIDKRKSMRCILENKLHPKSWLLLSNILEKGEFPNIKTKKEIKQIESIYNKCIDIMQNYLIDLDSHIHKHKQYIDTKNKNLKKAKV